MWLATFFFTPNNDNGIEPRGGKKEEKQNNKEHL